MKKLIFKTFLLLSIIFLNRCKSFNNCDEIHNLMKEQEKYWNMGSIDDFMDKYWDDDSLIFISKSGINYGWEKTISNYKKSYRNKNDMGKLEFENIFCKPINKTTHLITGRWNIYMSDSTRNSGGYYSLIWVKKNKEWKIIYDHTS